jgi:putative ABC transport system permease protein
MKLIIRNFIFVIKRFTTSSVINVLGLSVAFAVFFVIIVQTFYDFGFNRHFKNADNIYLYTLYYSHIDFHSKTTTYSAQTLAERYPEIENYCFIMEQMLYYDALDTAGNKTGTFQLPTIYSNEGGNFADMFTPEILSGDAHQAFTPGRAMLTESVAKILFGNENPVDKVFLLTNTNISYTVAAVCRDFPENCSFKNGIYVSRPHDREGEYSYTSYIQLSSGKDKILGIENKDINPEEGIPETKLTALTDIHLKFPSAGKGSISTTLSLLAIGILLIAVAYINFLNFAAAMAPVRRKSFNIRRIFGESSVILKMSVVMEAVFLSFIAFLFSLLIVHYFNGGVIKDFFIANLSLSKNTGLILSVGAASLVMGCIAGLYPAFYSTSFKPAIVVKSASSISSGSTVRRNVLIGIQFVSMIFLVIVSGFIKLQHDYMQDKSWGIRKENVVYFPVWQIKQDIKNFESALKSSPDIYDVAYSRYIPGVPNMMTWGLMYENKQINLTVWPVSSNFLQFFDVDITEGANFRAEDDSGKEKVIFNNTFVRNYELNNLLGKEFTGFNISPEENDMADIVGIAEDINFESLREPVKPMAFITGEKHWKWIGWMFVRINGQNVTKSLDDIRNTWKSFTPSPVDITFLNEMHNYLYRQENDLAKLISIFGLITIIVAVMGVYGLILFDAKSKRKVIALHKVHGASKLDVILMLNRNFIFQFMSAYIIAVPIAYYTVNRWLENFAYKTPIHWWVFAFGGLLVFFIIVATVSWQSYRAASINPIEAIKSE